MVLCLLMVTATWAIGQDRLGESADRSLAVEGASVASFVQSVSGEGTYGGSVTSSAETQDTTYSVIRFVFGSDTSTPGIHLRTKTANYANSNFDLFRSPDRQTARIMDPDFRDRFRDSSGEPFRFVWWVQTGSLYRYATNTNVPYPSLMTLYLMDKYHRDNVELHGDEYTYHYHTWVWSDATGDGIYYWNQTPQYIDSRDDFFINMAEALIEEDMFPVSFRSGWHFMDNDWQADLNDWIPFSLHNAWPANRTDSPEPVNNINVWNEATSDWVPFRPHPDNYMLPGGEGGWNTRSIHFTGVREATIREIFEAADQGVYQVPCIWSHVAENTFIEDLERVFGLIEKVAEEYPHIEYYYDTAIEAMQGWLQTDDTTPPQLQVDEIPAGDGYRIRVQSDKPLFMKRPFLAAKDVYEQFRRVEMVPAGPLTWESEEILTPKNAVSWSVAATDSSGNQAKHHKDWLPGIVYVDDEHDGRGTSGFEVKGSWRVADYFEIDAVWGSGAHVADASTEAASARWSKTIADPAHYDVQIRFPSGPELPGQIPYSVYRNGGEVRAGTIRNAAYDRWIHLHDMEISAGDEIAVEIRREEGGEPSTLTADAIRFTAYRPPRHLTRSAEIPDLGFIQTGDSKLFHIEIENRGYEPAEIISAESKTGRTAVTSTLPATVPGRSQAELAFEFESDGYGILRDTLILQTSDPGNPVFTIPVDAFGKGLFQLVDNEDDAAYEESGSWNYSVTQAYGSSSRWISISEANRDAYARYSFSIDETARYALSFIVPGASNSALRALYEVRLNEQVVLAQVVDQNAKRSIWRWLGSIDAMAGDGLVVMVSMADTDQPGRVLRADAMQIEQLAPDRHPLILHNESDAYTESGTWHTSNAQAWGNTSRYTSSPSASASYAIDHSEAGLAELEILLPETENAVTRARYRVYRSDRNRLLGEAIIDQNEGSGDWAPVGVFQVDMAGAVEVVVDFPDDSGMDGVLRADAIRWTAARDPSDTRAGDGPDTPAKVRLHQNYPNPFNPVTTIGFETAQADQHTKLVVYDVLGRRVGVLVDAVLPAGRHSVPFDGSGIASGVYIYRLESGGTVLQRKMMLVK